LFVGKFRDERGWLFQRCFDRAHYSLSFVVVFVCARARVCVCVCVCVCALCASDESVE